MMESSPLSPPPSSMPHNQQKSAPQYRQSRQLPFELAQHVQVYFEEGMFTQGFRFLHSIVSADASSPQNAVTVPSPAYLAVMSTLSVHPSLTTRTTVREKREQANSALRLLRLFLKVTGPVNSRFPQAFSFTKYNHGEESDLNTYFADQGSLWSQAEDFWAVVGWSFNCSCLPGVYAARWEYWSLWMEFMLDVLETDWKLHHAQDTCEESLLWQYVELAPGGNTRARRMLRAIFADGNTSSLNEFRSIFRRELREPPSDDKPKKREVDVNVDAEVYGDYLLKEDSDDSSSEEENNLRPHRRSRTRTPSRRPTPKSSNQSLRSEYESSGVGASSLGSPRALSIRLRLLHLLSEVARHPTLTAVSPTTFPSLDELYTLFVEFVKPLPLMTFQQIISPSVHPDTVFSPEAHSTLCEFLLQRSIESAAPTVHSATHLTQTKLEQEYLPFCASKDQVDANCRVSLLLEALLRRLKTAGSLRYRHELRDAIDTGIQRRLGRVEEKMEAKRRKKDTEHDDEDEIAWSWLVESGERMKLIVNAMNSH